VDGESLPALATADAFAPDETETVDSPRAAREQPSAPSRKMENEVQLRNEPNNRSVFSGRPVLDTAMGLLHALPWVRTTTQGAAPGR